MRKIVLPRKGMDTISVYDVDENTPIFAKKGGVLHGMLVKDSEGWIVRIGGENGAYGYRKTLRECIEDGSTRFEYEFFVV